MKGKPNPKRNLVKKPNTNANLKKPVSLKALNPAQLKKLINDANKTPMTPAKRALLKKIVDARNRKAA